MPKELDVGIQAARAAGTVLLDYFRKGLKLEYKEACNPVSQADRDAQTVILETISRAFPAHAIVSEEGEQDQKLFSSSDLWIVDPLDGTTNFLHGIPQFAVSIAYIRDGKAQAGIVFNPTNGELFTCQAGAGAYRNGKQVFVSNSQTLESSLVAVGFYYDRGKIMEDTFEALKKLFYRQIQGVRRFGAAALDLCWVGTGEFDIFFEYQLHPWDFAAGALFVSEAGGIVTDCRGESPPFSKSSILATNCQLHPTVLEIVGLK